MVRCVGCRPIGPSISPLGGTGRTHQIRVHLSHIGCPILCDPYYGREREISASRLLGCGMGQATGQAAAPVLARHALHARVLSFTHPGTAERVEFEAPLPGDMETALRYLRKRGKRA